ncbi:MAG: NADH-quinone oxidoreductase subunit K [Desulfovibrio sp.]|jgi:NADH-quinone oxidoreductase subunit K|nr:NADH-quinone oxidoreductase subunit K [Desulfovibrio sp.]
MSDLFLFHLAGLLLLGLGFYGLARRRSLVGMLIALELLLNGAGLSVAASCQLGGGDPVAGQLTSLLIMGLAAAEATLVVAIILVVTLRAGDSNIDSVSELKG